jgi:hypothetical protein
MFVGGRRECTQSIHGLGSASQVSEQATGLTPRVPLEVAATAGHYRLAEDMGLEFRTPRAYVTLPMNQELNP